VREYFQRDIERTKKATTDGARERVAQRRRQKRETIPLVDMMRRLRSRMQLTCREQKQSSDRGWKGEEVLMSVEGVVVRRG
jgi:hypothetical protein